MLLELRERLSEVPDKVSPGRGRHSIRDDRSGLDGDAHALHEVDEVAHSADNSVLIARVDMDKGPLGNPRPRLDNTNFDHVP